MENALIIINAEDIPTAERIAATLEQYTVYVFDPVLIDRVATSGLKPVQFYPWENAPSYLSLHEKAHDQAYALEKELDTARQGILPEVSIYSWQHLNLYYLFMSLQWYQGLWNALGEKLKDQHLHIFLCDNPANYYFNSYLPSLLLLQFARHHDIPFSGYTYGEKEDISQHVPDLRGRNNDDYREFLLTHLPTCMYDIAYFNQEMRATGKTIVNVEAKYFSMPVEAHAHIQIVEADCPGLEIAADLRQKIEALLSLMAAKLDDYFARSLVTPAFRERQVQHIVNTYRSQLLSFFLLGRYFQAQAPIKILLSDHDTGLHGPLLAFAEQHYIPVLILPHSKTTPDLEFAYKNMHALTHPSQGDVILNRNHCRVPHFKIHLASSFQANNHFPAEVKTIGLLLNAFSLNGIYFANYRQYLDGIRQVAEFCSQNDLTLIVRCKPSYSLMQLLARELDLDIPVLVESAQISMAEYSERCDICLMYDTPTAGALNFLAKAIPILNPVLGPLTRHQTVTTHPHTIARESIADTLQRLASYKADPSLLQQFTMQQFASYLQLFADAQAMRVFL